MKLPDYLYRSERIGKNGKRFSLLKIRTLKKDFGGQFANEEGYTRWGKFLRRSKLDELPQIINILRGQMSLVGPRAELQEHISATPREIRDILLSVKPGLTSLSSIHFYDEEGIIQQSKDDEATYWQSIKPIKIALDVFYVQNKCFLLDLFILWATVKLVIRGIFRK